MPGPAYAPIIGDTLVKNNSFCPTGPVYFNIYFLVGHLDE